jgi:hypothetical protein
LAGGEPFTDRIRSQGGHDGHEPGRKSVRHAAPDFFDGALLADIGDILANYPDYPVARSEKYGQVLVSVPDEHDQVVYNLANALFTVFPGEDHGFRSDPETMQLLRNSFLNQQNEGATT